MKISIIGSQCTGKSTYIKDFLKNWPSYKLCEKPRYSDLIKEKKLSLNEDGNEESQKIILNSLVDQVLETPKGSNVIFDRSVLDNLIYTMWLNSNGKVSDAFVRETIKIVRETLPFYDILFFLPITKFSPVPFEPDVNRSSNPEYRAEIDNLFKSLMYQYNTGSKTYFPFDHDMGCPAIIEIIGNREERVQLTKFYVDDDGNPYSEEASLLAGPIDGETEAKQLLEESRNQIRTKNKNIYPVTKKKR